MYHDNVMSVEEKFKIPKLKLPIGTNSTLKCGQSNVESVSKQVGEVISTTAQCAGDRKAKIKIEIEFN